jgi:hypothetical protein
MISAGRGRICVRQRGASVDLCAVEQIHVQQQSAGLGTDSGEATPSTHRAEHGSTLRCPARDERALDRKKHSGRIDSLGLDENGSPVIFEYKRSVNENVINQSLFYLDWLLDHRAEFELLVMKNLSVQSAEQIDWSGPRLICVASDFTRYDEHAIARSTEASNWSATVTTAGPS